VATATKKAPATPTESALPTIDATPTAAPIISGYDTDLRFYASKYKQGGRVVYGLDLSPVEIAALISEPDPLTPSPGNRAIRPAHAIGFGKYIREHSQWIAPAMILRAPAIFHFDTIAEVNGAEFGYVSFPRLSLMDLHILDGQHRILGIHLALKGIAGDLDKARSDLASARRVEPTGKAVALARGRISELEKQRKRLSDERITVQIFVEEDMTAYKQMFFDIADNALGITASVKTRFDNRKVVNRAYGLTLGHPLLTGRVDPEGDRIGRGSPYMMGAKHLVEIIRILKVGLNGRISRRNEDEFKERDMADAAKKFLTVTQKAFPQFEALTLGQLPPDTLRKTSLLGSILMLRVLAGTYYELVHKHAFNDTLATEFLARLAPHMAGPVYEESIWMKEAPRDLFTLGGMAPHGRRQDLELLQNTLIAWAIEKPAFLDEPPAPRPTPEGEDEELDYGSGYTVIGAAIPEVAK